MTDGLIIAAPQSGSGKTLITLGLLAAYKAAGLPVASAKAGPDYIDPRFHESATGRASINLDPWAMRSDRVRALAASAADGADLFIAEGVMGLFDGAAAGGGSTADLARVLDLPVVLVVDAARKSQSVAALVHGFATFDPRVRVAGAILTRVGSDRHESMLRAALDSAGYRCFGAVRTDADLALPSRHLGLVQAREHDDLSTFIARAGAIMAKAIDLDGLRDVAGPLSGGGAGSKLPPLGRRIAVASDEAFAFAYPHLLQDWRQQDATIVPFSPLLDEAPDMEADAVFLPGGYPELHAPALAAAETFRAGMTLAVERGALIYGECGGYMVLGERLEDADGETHRMLGLLPHATSFAERRRQLGYRRLSHNGALPWPVTLTGHEFHYATLVENRAEPLFRSNDAEGLDLGAIGGVNGRVMGSFAHVIDALPENGSAD